MILIFASCKDENSFMSGDDEPCYSILVSAPVSVGTRAIYEETGEEIAVKWEKGDVLYVGSNQFVYKEDRDAMALFIHYGDLQGTDRKVKFGEDENGVQIQEKNKKCHELLVGDATGYDFTNPTTAIPLLPAAGKSLLHIQAKSPAMFMGKSLLKIKSLATEDYTVQLGTDPSLVFADKNEQLEIYVTVPAGTINSGKTLKFYFYAYDETTPADLTHGDEYHYYMKCNASVAMENDKVVKMPLPNKPTHVALQMGLKVKWATTNVGAAKEEEAGEYFSWGDVNPKQDYSRGSCITDVMSLKQMRDEGIIKSYDLTAEYDAATQNWGDDWRMPTKAEFEELISKCSRENLTIKYGDFYGWKFKSNVKGNNNYIFIPNAGHYEGTEYFEDKEYKGTTIGDYARAFCWSSTVHDKIDDKGGYSYSFDAVSGAGNKYTPRTFSCLRFCGRNVRPVRKSN